jgi:hypothetical protein
LGGLARLGFYVEDKGEETGSKSRTLQVKSLEAKIQENNNGKETYDGRCALDSPAV